MKHKMQSMLVLMAGLVCAGLAHSQMQSFTPLPTSNCGTPTSFTQANNCITFGDFNVYSLGLLYTQATFNATGTIPTTNPNPGDPYYVASAPGELGNDGYMVLMTGTNNNNVVTNGDGTLIDNAQSSPEGSTSTWATGPATETNPTFTGDVTTTWDATLSALRAETGAGSATDKFVMYFNLNETGNQGLDGIDLLAYLRITLTDADGLLAPVTFTLTGDPLAPSPYVYVHGTICVSSTAGFLGFGPCTAAQKALGGTDVNQNLGANTAAFALYNEQLSSLVLDANSGYDFMRAEMALSNVNNGYEQLFAAVSPFDRTVPIPAIPLLLGAGLLGFGLTAKRRK